MIACCRRTSILDPMCFSNLPTVYYWVASSYTTTTTTTSNTTNTSSAVQPSKKRWLFHAGDKERSQIRGRERIGNAQLPGTWHLVLFVASATKVQPVSCNF